MALFNLTEMPPPIEQIDETQEKVLDFFKEGNTQKYIAQYAFGGVEPRFSRAAAWNHLYAFIQDHLDELKVAKPDSDLYSRACAELAAYLAAFGMYRYPTKLMMTNKVIFAPVLHSLIQTSSQQNIKAYQDRFSQEQIKALIDITRSALNEAATVVPLAVTDTLTSKILHGIFACIPAYDQFFIAGVHAANTLLHSCSFCKEEIAGKEVSDPLFPQKIDQSFEALLDWAFDSNVLPQLQNIAQALPSLVSKKADKIDIVPYPIMRIVDQIFWALGRSLKKNNKKK